LPSKKKNKYTVLIIKKQNKNKNKTNIQCIYTVIYIIRFFTLLIKKNKKICVRWDMMEGDGVIFKLDRAVGHTQLTLS